MHELRPDGGKIVSGTSAAESAVLAGGGNATGQGFGASGEQDPVPGRGCSVRVQDYMTRLCRRRPARRHRQQVGGIAGGMGQALELRILLAATLEMRRFSVSDSAHSDLDQIRSTDEMSGAGHNLPDFQERRERQLARKGLRFRGDRGWGYSDYVSSSRGPTPTTGLNINLYLGADRFYLAGYTGKSAVVANIEAGHAWSSHESLQHVSATTQALVNAGSQTGEFDRHATWTTQLMAGRPTAPTLEYQRGLAWEASLLSGSIATNWVGASPYRQSFSFNTSTFMTPYRDAMVNGVGPLGMTADVINSSWGNSDSTGSAYGTFSRAIDGLAAISGTTVVFSAGNSGAGTNKVGGPAAGYNTIAVGALGSDTATIPYNAVSSFSSRGPNDLFIPYVSQPTSVTDPAQGRLIPGARAVVDIAAPGQNQTAALYGGTTGGNVGGTDSTGGATNQYSANLQGTSFSAPTVAGGLGLMADAARSVFGGSSTALDGRVMQSVLQTSADKIPGWNNGQGLSGNVIRTTQSLDYASGAGRMNLSRAYDVLLTGTTDVPGSGGGTVAARGWDFGQVQSGVPVDYRIAGELLAGTSFTTTLAWFVDRGVNLINNATTEQSFDDLNLEVWKTVNGAAVTKVAESVSPWNNVEHLHFVVPETAAYLVRVIWSGEVWDLISDADVEQYALSWIGTAQNVAPEISVEHRGNVIGSGAGIDFGTTAYGSVRSEVITIRNVGTAVLNVQPAGILSGSGFSITTNFPESLSIAPNSAATLVVRLDAAIPGVKTALLSFSSNDADESPIQIRLTGEVLNPPGLVVTPSSGSIVVSESGVAGTVQVALTAAPSSGVIVSLSPADAGEVRVTPASLQFTALNWNQPQTITITGVDDQTDDGDQFSVIAVAISGADSAIEYRTVSPVLVGVINLDDDTQAIVSSPESLTIPEGSSGSFSVRLAVEPVGVVLATIERVEGDSDITVASGGHLVFTPENWSVPQWVTVAAAVDADTTSGSATLRIASPGLPDVMISVAEADNRQPLADAGGPYVVAEGAGLVLDASGSSDPDPGDAIVEYAWDLNGDGQHDDLISSTAQYVLSQSQREALGLGDGPSSHPIAVRVTDSRGATSAAASSLRITNTAPVVSVSAPVDGYSGVRGQKRTVRLSAADPSAADMAGDFLYSVSWGDGTPIQQITGAAMTLADHVYVTNGTYQIQVRVADRDGAVSEQAATASVVIGVTEFQGSWLAIGGTSASDSFVMTQAESADSVTVSLGALTLGTFHTGAAGRVVVFGHTGTDTLRINGRAVADQIVVAGGVVLLNDLSIESDSVETPSIYGLAGDDQFTTDNTALRIDGGAGLDTLKSTAAPSSGGTTGWAITNLNIGVLNGSVVFAGTENLDGTLNRNAFTFSGIGRISGQVSGSDMSDVMDFQSANSGVTVNLGTQTSSRVGRIVSLDSVVGSAFADSLIGPHGANLWLLTGYQTGQLNGSFQFSGVENLTGSVGDDQFLLSGAAGGFGTVNASSGTDVLSYEAFGGSVSVSLETQQATGLTRHLGFERIVAASGTSDVLTARNAVNTWLLTGPGSGRVGTLEFAGFENLNGGSLDDWFRMHTAGRVSGAITGGAGLNVLDYSFFVSPTGVQADLRTGQATAVGSVQQISGLIGSDADDQLFGGDQPGVILGGAGNDILRGGGGADVLIGGSGGDSISGGSGSDLLFGGRVSFYSEGSKGLNLTSLRKISVPWQSEVSYAERIALLTSGTTPPVRSATFSDDVAAVDFLFGEAGQDWYLLRALDQVFGTEPDEETLLL